MRQELELQLQQQLKLNPQLQQSLKLLQFSQLELAQEIQIQLDSNPLLCTDSMNSDSDSDNSDTPLDQPITAEVPNYKMSNLNSRGFDANNNPWENIADTGDLKEKLEFQLQMNHLSRLDLEIGYYIIENLNDQGFLSCSINNICQQIKKDTDQSLSENDIQPIIHLIQTLEPFGCASKGLQEFLLLQLKQKDCQLNLNSKELTQATIVLQDHFSLLSENKYSAIELKLKISHEQFQSMLKKIQSLRQQPNDYQTDTTQNYIRPDITIVQDNHQWRALVTQQQLPKLRLNPDYLALSKTVNSDKDKKYFQEKTQQAQQFLQSLEARENTLQKVANFMVKHQTAYFDLGDGALKPLKLNDIADSLELHESTISRATSNKYCQTPNGIIRLKSLFSNAITNQEGIEWSQIAIKNKIQQFIQSEPSRKPFSDNSIVSLLKQQRITIARRTVAKYRDALRIPTASKRKQLSSFQPIN